MKDTARVLGRMYDGIEYHGFGQELVEILGKYAGVPVWNGLTNEFHPTQMICDILTMMEHSDKHLNQISYCYLGDARNNMGNSLMVTGCKLGMDVRLCAPKALWPEAALVETCRKVAAETGARLTITESVEEGVKGVDYLYTDVWVSMGEAKEVWDERIKLLKPTRSTWMSLRPATPRSSSCTACRPSTTARRKLARTSIKRLAWIALR